MTRKVLRLPNSLGDKSLINFFRGWEWSDSPPDELIIDLSACEFVAPWAITLLSTYSLWAWEERDSVVTVRYDPKNRAGRYIVQSGLYELLEWDRPASAPGHDDSRTAQLTSIKSSSDVAPFANNVLELLKIDDEELAGAVKYSLVELLRNVVQHSRSPVGGVAMAQYYPAAGMVEIAVADAGVGILTTLGPRYGELTDHLAGLKLSLLPHVSGTFGMGAYGSMLDNAGLGLFFIREIAARGGGAFFLGSGDSLIDLWGNADGSPGKRYVKSRWGGWRGTFAVLLLLRRERIEEFNSLLRVCRRLAAEARKDSTEVELDFVHEVPDFEGQQVIGVDRFEEDVDQAALIREERIIPALNRNEHVVLDFDGIAFATQSFVHALMYRILKEVPAARSHLSLARVSEASQEAIRAVAAYARTGNLPYNL